MTSAYTVLAILEAKPGKETILKNHLINIAKLSRAETTCLEYRLHQDHANPAQFILYETWKSQAEHQQQFSKSYIIEFVAQLGDLLAKPYQGYSAIQL